MSLHVQRDFIFDPRQIEAPVKIRVRRAKEPQPIDVLEALEMAEEKEAIAQFGSSDSGASLGDILGAALKAKK